MNLNIIDKSTEADFNKIVQLIKLRKNGVVADSLSNSGLNYELIWGVSIPYLRNIANSFKPNNDLALLLWNKKWRETMILATMLTEIEHSESNHLDQWLFDVDNLELAEQLAFNLLSNVQRPYTFWLDLLQQKTGLQRLCVLKGLYRLVLRKNLDQESAASLLDGITAMPVIKDCSMLEITAFGKLYACMGRTYPDLIKAILTFIYKFVEENSSWEAIIEIVETEFNWLNET